jgi:hypothetical protein
MNREELKRAEDFLREIEREKEQDAAPYPWCHGNPTVQDCIEAGYCQRNPSCGE